MMKQAATLENMFQVFRSNYYPLLECLNTFIYRENLEKVRVVKPPSSLGMREFYKLQCDWFIAPYFHPLFSPLAGMPTKLLSQFLYLLQITLFVKLVKLFN